MPEAKLSRASRSISSQARSVSCACNCESTALRQVSGKGIDVALRRAGSDDGASGEGGDWRVVIVDLAGGVADARKPASISAFVNALV